MLTIQEILETNKMIEENKLDEIIKVLSVLTTRAE